MYIPGRDPQYTWAKKKFLFTYYKQFWDGHKNKSYFSSCNINKIFVDKYNIKIFDDFDRKA